MTNYIVFFDTDNHDDGFDFTYIDANTRAEAERLAADRIDHGSDFYAMTGPEYDDWVEQEQLKVEAYHNR